MHKRSASEWPAGGSPHGSDRRSRTMSWKTNCSCSCSCLCSHVGASHAELHLHYRCRSWRIPQNTSPSILTLQSRSHAAQLHDHVCIQASPRAVVPSPTAHIPATSRLPCCVEMCLRLCHHLPRPSWRTPCRLLPVTPG